MDGHHTLTEGAQNPAYRPAHRLYRVELGFYKS